MAINFPSTNLYNGYTHVVGDVTFTYNSTKTLWEPSTAAPTIHNTPVDGSDTIAISSNWAFDSVKTIVPENALFTDTEVDWTTAQSGSVIDSSNIPVIALTSIQTAANEAAQLALTTQEGDVVVRTDENKNYIRNNGVVGTMADFTALATPIDATGWTGGAYNASDGKITFSSDDGLGFVTDDLRGASTEFSGSGAGLVPNITPANSTKFLRADGSWVVPTDTDNQRAISSTPTDGATETSISSDWAFDNVKSVVPENAVFTDTQVAVDNTLTSTSTTDALSANQGKELKTLVDAAGSSSICYILIMGQSNVGAFGDPSYTYTPTPGNIVRKWSLNESWVECPAQVNITDNQWGLGNAATETTVTAGTRIPTLVDYLQSAYSGITAEQYNAGLSIFIATYTYPSSGVLETTWADGSSGGSYLAELGDNIINSTDYDEVRFVNISVGGSSITQWDPTSSIPFPLGAAPAPQTSVQDDFTYSTSRLLWERVEYAKNLATTQNFNYDYIFWCQGEADNRGVDSNNNFWPTQGTPDQMSASTYTAKLKLITHKLEEMGIWSLTTPIVMARTSFVRKNSSYPDGGYDSEIILGQMGAFSTFNAPASLTLDNEWYKHMLYGPNLDLDYHDDFRITGDIHLNSAGMSKIADEWADVIINNLYQIDDPYYYNVLSKYLLPSLKRAMVLCEAGVDNTALEYQEDPIMLLVNYLQEDIGADNSWGGSHHRADMSFRILEHYYDNPRDFSSNGTSTFGAESNFNNFISTNRNSNANAFKFNNDYDSIHNYHYIQKWVIYPLYGPYKGLFIGKLGYYRTGYSPKGEQLDRDHYNRMGHEIAFGDSILLNNDLNSISDVDLTTTAPASNNVLVYNGTDWVPGTPAFGALNDLSDVTIGTPITDQVLKYNGTEWSLGFVSGGSGGGSGGLSSRSTTATTTSAINDDINENVTFTGFKSYMLMGIQTSAAAWVRLYTNSPARIADATRGEGEDPGPDAGVIAEVLSNGAQTIGFSPGVLGWNTANDTTIYAAVKNKSGSSLAITTTLTLLQLEA